MVRSCTSSIGRRRRRTQQDDVSQDNLNSVLDPDTPDKWIFRNLAKYSSSMKNALIARKLEQFALT
jgi:hypothetical protein